MSGTSTSSEGIVWSPLKLELEETLVERRLRIFNPLMLVMNVERFALIGLHYSDVPGVLSGETT
jgi:hypothetical protein